MQGTDRTKHAEPFYLGHLHVLEVDYPRFAIEVQRQLLYCLQWDGRFFIELPGGEQPWTDYLVWPGV
ncbi:MAG: hypothetical protein EB072_06615 [Betaproteobacteria bacterium]|nr:hypothetical protein [Betaproteobacteria bacterium]